MATKKTTPAAKPASLTPHEAFLASLTDEQRAQFAAMAPPAPGQDETVPTSVSAVGAAQKANGGASLPVTPKRPGLTINVTKRDKRSGAIKTHTIPTVEALRAYGPLTMTLTNARGETVAVWNADAKTFGTGSWGFNVGGTKLVLDVGAGAPYTGQVSVNLTQIHSKPGADE